MQTSLLVLQKLYLLIENPINKALINDRVNPATIIMRKNSALRLGYLSSDSSTKYIEYIVNVIIKPNKKNTIPITDPVRLSYFSVLPNKEYKLASII